GLFGIALLPSEPRGTQLEREAAACAGDRDPGRGRTWGTGPPMVDHAHDPTGAPRHDHHPVLAFMLGQGLGERGGVEVHGLTGEVPQDMHLVDAAVDEYPATVQGAAAPPLAWLERGLLVQLH